jgi:ABC-type sugar transport system permease subunit
MAPGGVALRRRQERAMTQTPGASPSAAPAPPGPERWIGLALLLPALVTLLWSYVVPTISTLLRSFQRYSLLTPPQPAGTKNYENVFQDAFGTFGFGLVLILVPLIVGLVIAPVLAMAAHRGGQTARRVTLALTALPLACYAPVAVAIGWTTTRLSREDLSTPGGAQGSLVSVVAWSSIGLIVAIGTTLALAALRGRRPAAAILAVGAVVVLGVIAAGLQQFTIPQVLTFGGPGKSTMIPLVQMYRTSFAAFNFGLGSAWSIVLMLILAGLGIIAVAILLTVRARVEYAPAADNPPARNQVALIVTGVLLLLLLVIIGYGLAPWLGSLFGGNPLPKGLSIFGIEVRTWLPPLISAVVGVLVALLGGIGIGAFRPLGARSELLLLIFAPWLFVGTGPLALAGFERAEKTHQLNTFLGLIPPSWLSIPALVIFTLLMRGLSGQWRAAGSAGPRLVSMVGLPALPMVGAAVLAVWLAGAQDFFWPSLIASDPINGTAGTVGVYGIYGQFSNAIGAQSGALGLIYPIPLLVLFVLAFVALGIWYLERLAIQVGPETQSFAPQGTVPTQYAAWQGGAYPQQMDPR